MSSTRQSYDDSSFTRYVNQSTKPGKEMLRTDGVHKLACYPDVSAGHPTNFVDFDADQVRVENALSNRTPQAQRGGTDTKKDTVIPPTCDKLVSHNTLLTHPKSAYRGLSTDEFNRNFLAVNPQTSFTDFVSYAGKNTRQIVVDHYNETRQLKK